MKRILNLFVVISVVLSGFTGVASAQTVGGGTTTTNNSSSNNVTVTNVTKPAVANPFIPALPAFGGLNKTVTDYRLMGISRMVVSYNGTDIFSWGITGGTMRVPKGTGITFRAVPVKGMAANPSDFRADRRGNMAADAQNVVYDKVVGTSGEYPLFDPRTKTYGNLDLTSLSGGSYTRISALKLHGTREENEAYVPLISELTKILNIFPNFGTRVKQRDQMLVIEQDFVVYTPVLPQINDQFDHWFIAYNAAQAAGFGTNGVIGSYAGGIETYCAIPNDPQVAKDLYELSLGMSDPFKTRLEGLRAQQRPPVQAGNVPPVDLGALNGALDNQPRQPSLPIDVSMKIDDVNNGQLTIVKNLTTETIIIKVYGKRSEKTMTLAGGKSFAVTPNTIGYAVTLPSGTTQFIAASGSVLNSEAELLKLRQ